MEKPKDKRTKKYKEWKKSQGLGDDIEKVLEKTGIKKVVELFTPEGKDCGCEERKKKLNKLFPRQKANCLNESQYNQWSDFRNKYNKNGEWVGYVTEQDQDVLVTLVRDILNASIKPCKSCGGAWKAWIKKIDSIYNEYKK